MSRPGLVLTVLTLLVTVGFAQGPPLPSTVLNVLWRVNVNNVDYMTTISSAERNMYPSAGAIFYVNKPCQSPSVTLWRLFDSRIPDHMDSTTPGESGYWTEGALGCPWITSTAVPGLTELIRVHNTAGDHATIKPTESLQGYNTIENLNVWGYARYNAAPLSLLSLSAGGVTIQSNGVAGGALWTWTWNGIQFINNDDYGREMQSALFYYPSGSSSPQNPTEAGDVFSTSTIIPEARHGSPILNIQNNSGSVQVTRSIPLDFNGGGQDNPVVYQGMQIGKNITLNYNNMGPVALYETHLVVPIALSSASLEIPTAYLRSSPFKYFYTYDAESRALTSVDNILLKCNDHFRFSPRYGGVIISDGGSNAMGVYSPATSVGGSTSYFELWFLATCGNTNKWNAVYEGPIAAGETTYRTWVMTGSLSQVTQFMNQLYASR